MTWRALGAVACVLIFGASCQEKPDPTEEAHRQDLLRSARMWKQRACEADSRALQTELDGERQMEYTLQNAIDVDGEVLRKAATLYPDAQPPTDLLRHQAKAREDLLEEQRKEAATVASLDAKRAECAALSDASIR